MIRHTTLLAILLAAALSIVLFGVKYQVQDLEQELTSIERGILAEERAIHVLRAEWAHLNDPERLRPLAEKYLGMGPVSAAQLGTLNNLPDAADPAQPGVHAAALMANGQGGAR